MFEYTVEYDEEFDRWEVVEWDAWQHGRSRSGKIVFKSRILEEAETIREECQYNAMSHAEELLRQDYPQE